VQNSSLADIPRADTRLASGASRNLPAAGHLLTCAVLLPAVVAAANQLLIAALPDDQLRRWLYPAMAASTAVLSWCAGRYLYPGWLSWVVFTWSLALLDLISVAVCLGGPIDEHFGYLMVATQLCLVVLWAILSQSKWQWRIPAVLVATPIVIMFSRVLTGSAYVRWRDPEWMILMAISTAVVAMLCGSLRLASFRLQVPEFALDDERSRDHVFQFGLRHMLVWSAAIVPLLLVARGVDFLTFGRIPLRGIFPLTLVAASLALINLTAIWTVLGSGFWILRLAALLIVPSVLAYALHHLTLYLESITGGYPGYPSLLWVFHDVKESWTSWLIMSALLLSALLLFVRARGYRLLRHKRAALDS
jgi:hypothetical protein